MKGVDHALLNHFSSSSAKMVDQRATFKRMNMVSSTSSWALIGTIHLRNTFFYKDYQIFIPYLSRRTHKYLIPS
jgi:hypothetical protein